MKRSLNLLLENYPIIEKKLNGENIPLTNTEDVFYQLALYIKDPETYSFNINLLYKFLKDKELIDALHIIFDFFQKDTNLITTPENTFINKEDLNKEEIYNQSTFAKYLTENGLKYTPNKINTYFQRGKIPRADITIGGKPYWFESTVESYLKQNI
ncbi:hypothetical protein [Gottfriedia solisilvae]|uniref:hypothetical protein n=1 Tax=Gottfriedia solisilvae TaxID=1516104 RepID=UPI003D2EACEA